MMLKSTYCIWYIGLSPQWPSMPSEHVLVAGTQFTFFTHQMTYVLYNYIPEI